MKCAANVTVGGLAAVSVGRVQDYPAGGSKAGTSQLAGCEIVLCCLCLVCRRRDMAPQKKQLEIAVHSGRLTGTATRNSADPSDAGGCALMHPGSPCVCMAVRARDSSPASGGKSNPGTVAELRTNPG